MLRQLNQSTIDLVSYSHLGMRFEVAPRTSSLVHVRSILSIKAGSGGLADIIIDMANRRDVLAFSSSEEEEETDDEDEWQ